MIPNNLLSHLTNLEGQLNHFSFEELTSEEASQLKKSFMSFKYRLEEKVLGPQSKVSTAKNKDFDLSIGHKEMSNISKNNLNRVGGKLLAKIGDEIRTPINGIIESVDVLKEANLTTEQLLQLNSISNSSNNLLEIINELLEYTKLTSGKEKFENIDFNFYSLVKDTMYLCNTLIINKDVGLEVNLDTKIPEILNGDPSKLSQILLTLLGNSIKLINQGNLLLRIKLKGLQQDFYVLEFEISDSGAPQAKNRSHHNIANSIGNETNEHDYGISLAIIKGIITILNGSMIMIGTLSNGPAFRFTIPYKRSRKLKKISYTKHTDSTNSELKNIEGLHVLVFEDNILVQKIIEQRLKKWGCIVQVTENGQAGVDYLHEHAVDLVIMDLRLPVMKGLRVVKKIRESHIGNFDNIPIVVLSGDVTLKDKNKFKALGIDAFILKPYSPDELLSILYKYKMEIDSNPELKSKNQIAPFVIDEEPNELSLTSILEECMGELDLLEELIGLFKQNMLDFIGRANVYIPEGNFNRLGFAAHKVKTGLSMMNAHKLYSLVDEIVVCCRTNKDLPKIGRLYDQLLLSYPLVEKAIEKELKLLKDNRK